MLERVKEVIRSYGLPRTIITSFFAALCLLAMVVNIPIAPLMSDILVRMGMNGILVLAMVPAILSGIGLNFGLPLGVLCGLLGALTAIELTSVALRPSSLPLSWPFLWPPSLALVMVGY